MEVGENMEEEFEGISRKDYYNKLGGQINHMT